jgi:hypothetical protein
LIIENIKKRIYSVVLVILMLMASCIITSPTVEFLRFILWARWVNALVQYLLSTSAIAIDSSLLPKP